MARIRIIAPTAVLLLLIFGLYAVFGNCPENTSCATRPDSELIHRLAYGNIDPAGPGRRRR